MTKFDSLSLPYIAGFFDADGSVGAYSRARGMPEYVQVALVNTFPDVLKMIHQDWGGHLEDNTIRKSKCWLLRLTTVPAKQFLEAIQPYVVVKRTQVELALDIINLPRLVRFDPRTEEVRLRRTEMALRLKELKKW